MGKILIGIAIVLLDFVVELGGGRILDITPDMIGYILVIFGLRELREYSHQFANASKVSVFAAVAAGTVFGVSLVTGQASMSMTIILVGIAEMVLQVVLLVMIAKGFSDMEKDFEISLKSKWLKIIAICMAPGIALGYCGAVVPVLEMVGSLVVDIASFAYLILLYFAWESYKVWKDKEEE